MDNLNIMDLRVKSRFQNKISQICSDFNHRINLLHVKIFIIKWEKLLKGPIDLVQFSLLHIVSKILVNNCLLTFLPTFLLSYLKENENT